MRDDLFNDVEKIQEDVNSLTTDLDAMRKVLHDHIGPDVSEDRRALLLKFRTDLSGMIMEASRVQLAIDAMLGM